MSERIELWATVRSGCVQAYYRDCDLAKRLRHPDEQIVHLVELRDGESIVGNFGLDSRPPLIPNDELRDRVAKAVHANDVVEPVGERTRTRLVPESELTAMKERAEKAEAALERATRDDGHWVPVAELWRLQSIVTKECDEQKSRALSAESRLADERAKFERECAMRFRSAYLTHGDGDFSELEEARKLTDHYFGAKEAK